VCSGSNPESSARRAAEGAGVGVAPSVAVVSECRQQRCLCTDAKIGLDPRRISAVHTDGKRIVIIAFSNKSDSDTKRSDVPR
jgi:hypothetical protein